MRKIIPFVFVVVFLLIPKTTKAQNPFFVKVDLISSNYWSATFLSVPVIVINTLLAGDDDEITPVGMGVSNRFASYKKAGETLEVYGPNSQPFWKHLGHNWKQAVGFRAENLFRDFEYSVKFGWQPVQIPVGFYGRFGFLHESFRYKLPEDDQWIKHRINTLRPGLGIRISPLENLIEENEWCPIIELGSTYNFHVGYSGGYDDDKDELNNGLSTHVAVGVKFEAGWSILFDAERDHYNLFNQDYEYEGAKPYADITSNRWNFTISANMEF